MANSRSDVIANLLAKPMEFNSVQSYDGRKRYRRAQFTTIAADAAGTLYPCFRVSAFDRILKLEVSNTADAGMTDLDVGAYVAGDWTVADQAVVNSSADKLVDGANRAAATTQPVNIWGTGTNSFGEALQGKQLWEQIGLASAPTPGTQYDIVVKSNGDPAGGTYVLEMEYVAGS